MDTNANKKQMSLSEKKKFFAFRISPVRHFRRIMIASFFCFVAIVAFHGYLFYKVRFHDVQKGNIPDTVPVPAINQDKLETVLSIYDARAKTQQKVSSLPSPVVDPSK